ncbi:MAG: GNAT family N-acetyltransferase [Oscillospiraceae bacterium]|jgi:GNAT superfamily N-acetyltransferase|nr:GNAT family N-acetyltransferase [Oscillospiraceae bacterium]
MIRLLEDETPAFVAFCGRDPLAARALASLRSYAGLRGTDAAQCWVQEAAPAQVTAALSLADGFAVLSATAEADRAELTAFLRMIPWHNLQCDAAVAQHLPYPEDWDSCVVRFNAPARAMPAGLAISPANDPGTVYDLLERCGFPDIKNRSLWLADMALRWRRGTAQSWLIHKNDNICNSDNTVAALGAASAMAITERLTFLGAVGTLPEARGQGLAGMLLTKIATEQQAQGRAVYLSCRRELLGFYQSVGFAEAGAWVCLRG